MVSEQEREVIGWAVIGNAEAMRLCEVLLNCAHVIDDLFDGDRPIDKSRLFGTFYSIIFELPQNSFFVRHQAELLPVMRVSYHDWLDANMIEQSASGPNELSFVLRDTYINVVFACAELVGGPAWRREVAERIRAMHHNETFKQYQESHNVNR